MCIAFTFCVQEDVVFLKRDDYDYHENFRSFVIQLEKKEDFCKNLDIIKIIKTTTKFSHAYADTSFKAGTEQSKK